MRVVAGARLDAALAARSRDAVRHRRARDGVDEGGLSTACKPCDNSVKHSESFLPFVSFRWSVRIWSGRKRVSGGSWNRAEDTFAIRRWSRTWEASDDVSRERFNPWSFAWATCFACERKRERERERDHRCAKVTHDNDDDDDDDDATEGEERSPRDLPSCGKNGREEERGEREKGNATLTPSGLTREAPRRYLHEAQVPASRHLLRPADHPRSSVSPIATTSVRSRTDDAGIIVWCSSRRTCRHV